MPIPVTCSTCGAKFTLKGEFAGQKVRCSDCQAVLTVPEAEEDLYRGRSSRDDDDDRPRRERRSRDYDEDDDDRPRRERRSRDYDEDEEDQVWGDTHPAFRYDKFLMRQKLFTILTEKYNVQNEHGEPLLFIERPAMFMASCVAVGAFCFVMALGVIGAVVIATELNGAAGIAAAVVVGLIALVIASLLLIRLIPRRHITFYADESKREPLMRVLQDQKFFLINAWYTLVDDRGEVLARFRKNYLYNIFRKRWYVYDTQKELLCTVKEDSLILSLLRRTVGSFLEEAPLLGLAFAGVFRTNFIFLHAEDERILGEFNRRFTLLDRYVLDMTRDKKRIIDRRVASAMGVLLDTGEGR